MAGAVFVFNEDPHMRDAIGPFPEDQKFPRKGLLFFEAFRQSRKSKDLGNGTGFKVVI